MANNLFISYDLYKKGQDYEAVISKIHGLGAWAKIHLSYFYVNSSLTAEQAAKEVWSVMDKNDKLIVVDATNNDAHWFNLPKDVEKQIQDQWFL